MSSNITNAGGEAMLRGEIDFKNDVIRAILLDNAPSAETTANLAQIEAGRIGADQVLQNVEVAGGWVKSDNITFAGLPTNLLAVSVALYKWTGAADSSPVIAIFDDVTGFPRITTDGAVMVSVQSGWFRLKRSV
ncbi:MAG: hypothetical protein LBU11_13265 [Zoogloeaceae bacterium]|jgi:hypothetical protein|nr:hypothetical protein [Zoogloeaceae bacterium]